MSGKPSRAIHLALAYMLRTGANPKDAALRYKVSRSGLTRAMHRVGMPVVSKGRPRKGATTAFGITIVSGTPMADWYKPR